MLDVAWSDISHWRGWSHLALGHSVKACLVILADRKVLGSRIVHIAFTYVACRLDGLLTLHLWCLQVTGDS